MLIRATALALCASGALVGCSSEAGPRTLPPVPSLSPTPAVLPVPPEATPATARGAAAFARYYFQLINQGLSTGVASAVQGVSDPGCGGCTNLIGAIEEEPTVGERIEGGLFELIFAESPPVEDGEVIVDLRYRVTEVRVLDEAGAILRRTPPAGPTNGQLRLLRSEGSWVVLGFRGMP